MSCRLRKVKEINNDLKQPNHTEKMNLLYDAWWENLIIQIECAHTILLAQSINGHSQLANTEDPDCRAHGFITR